MKEKFRDDLHLSKSNIARLEQINEILEEYQADGYVLTLRQLYYQLVTRDIIPNKQAEYAKLSTILVKGRMAGIVDRDIIEDRLRKPNLPYAVDDIDDAIYDTVNQYRLDRMKGQDEYIEIRVEKDALSGVLKRVSHKYHIRLMVNRGYSSCSAMKDAFDRFSNHDSSHIFYLGDHDPSGLDMIRDVRERLLEFGVDVQIHHLAITSDQIKKYAPPPNPAKITDPRAGRYIKNNGRTSWEVDALPPDVLIAVLEAKIKEIIDPIKFLEMVKREAREKKVLQKMVNDGVFQKYIDDADDMDIDQEDLDDDE